MTIFVTKYKDTMEQAIYDRFANDLRLFIPARQIYTDELRRFGWGTDASFYRLTPRIVVRAATERQVSEALRLCQQYGLPATFRAAGTSLSGQSVSDSVLIVAGKSWEGYAYRPADGSILLQPGLTGGRVNEILKPYGRTFPPDPASVASAMVGGIVANNASGMSCGVHANSDHMLLSARIILADGTLLDTGDDVSRRMFRKSHPDFIAQIERLRDDVRADHDLTERIRYKYSIKNVTGLNLRPLVDYDDPFDIIAHSMVGSEGTLAFLAAVRMRTLREYPFRASAMAYFTTMKESCHAVVALKRLVATDADIAMSAENLMVKAAEMLDYKSLDAVDDPVFRQYQKDVDAGQVAGVAPGDHHNLTALLIETKALSHEELQQQVAAITQTLSAFSLYRPVGFTDDPKLYGRYWALRAGIFPAVGGTRPEGTSCLIEDVAFHIEDLPEATVRLQQLIANHGYKDACIYGHAFEGNFHFILNQSFATGSEVARYASMMRDVARLVVDDYDGSLKAEHGTGRNMAPFVEHEWGKKAVDAMRRLKKIFDPRGLLNPGVIFNDDPECFIKHLKALPLLAFGDGIPGDGTPSQRAMRDGTRQANRCIECGFCEIHCVSCGFTLSSRMRIALQREMGRLEQEGDNPARLAILRRQYRYDGNQTCAADGLCASSCPMKINTGDMTHLLRELDMRRHPLERAIGKAAANHLAAAKQGLRGTLALAAVGQDVLGDKAMQAVCDGLHHLGVPLWTPAMPHAIRQPATSPLPPLQDEGPERTTGDGGSHRKEDATRKVVYFPSCINQTMGLAKGAVVSHSLVDETCRLLQKCGYEVVFPANMRQMCCGQIWESKGMMDIADRKTRELDDALWEASGHGRWPVLCDQSPCLHRMRKLITRMRLYEPVEFIMTCLRPLLDFHPKKETIAIHLTCSTREMHLEQQFIDLAKLCASDVVVPEGVGCCAFAGDKGFTHPELNRYALRKLRPQIEARHASRGFSNSRTCEIGLQANSGIPYQSIVYLVNEVTTPKRVPSSKVG